MSHHLKWISKILLALVLLIGVVLSIHAANSNRPGTYPPPGIPLKFSHKQHMTKKVACLTCHPEVVESTQASDRLLPNEKICAQCHTTVVRKKNQEVLTQKCLICHTGVDLKAEVTPKRVVYPAALINFDHQKHHKAGIACEKCHGDMATVDTPGTGILPKEEVCLSCHNVDQTAKGCATCHPTDNTGRMVEPRMPVKGRMDHRNRWQLRHAQIAKQQESACLACHVRSYCFDCHGGFSKPQIIHPSDYKLIHSVDAKRNPKKCQSCHGTGRDCRQCHERLGFARTNKPEATSTVVHPPGWGDCNLNANHHAYQAKRNLMACASCHAENSCIRCHRPNGACGGILSVHRHLSQSKLNDLKRRNPTACKKCHGNTL